ncbi:MAG: hypothetical protein VKP62_13365 [Candidatus Sericytochromatia bacterium]|nr:hypothetical protein [Candidatus Sericytochromatia bacterium]
MRRYRILGLLALSVSLAACQFTLSPLQLNQGGTPPQGGGLISNQDAGLISNLSGVVRAPAGYAGVGGDPFSTSQNLIGLDAATLVGMDGASLRGTRQLLQAEAGEEAPLANTTVMLTDAAGTPLPGIPATVTDARGNFTFPRVPDGYTLVVMAAIKRDGKVAYMKSLAQAGQGGAEIDSATTLTTAALLEDGSAGRLFGKVDLASFKRIKEKVKAQLRKEGRPDLTDARAIQARAAKLKDDPEIKRDLEDAKAALKNAKRDDKSLEDLSRKVEAEDLRQAKPAERPMTCLESFKQRDLDGDGAVTYEEMLKFARSQTREPQAGPPGEPQEKPGAVTDVPPQNAPTRRLAGAPVQVQQMVEQDAPAVTTALPPVGDQRPGTPEGLEARVKREFIARDKNGDGRITPEEVCEEMPIKPPAPLTCEEKFKTLDRDRDGRLSVEELFDDFTPQLGPDGRPMLGRPNPKSKLEGLDLNGDGFVDLKEFCRPADEPNPEPLPEDCAGRFKQLDQDQNGGLSFEELLQGATRAAINADEKERIYEQTKLNFTKWDADNDGRLSPKEYCEPGLAPDPAPPCPDVYRKQDADGDGALSFQEMLLAAGHERAQGQEREAIYSKVKTRFQALDRNQDMKVSLAEFCGEVTLPGNPCDDRFKKLDRDADGRLSVTELFEGFEPITTADGRMTTIGRPNPEAQLKAMDLNGDGFVDRKEYGIGSCEEGDAIRPTPTPAPTARPTPAPSIKPSPVPTSLSLTCDERFKRAAGSDGLLGPDEVAVFEWNREMFIKYDLNKDNRIDRKEFGQVFCQESPTGTVSRTTTTSNGTTTTTTTTISGGSTTVLR